MLNVALLGKTVKHWREDNAEKREISERLVLLRELAVRQMRTMEAIKISALLTQWRTNRTYDIIKNNELRKGIKLCIRIIIFMETQAI